MIIDDSKIDLFLQEKLIKLSGISDDVLSYSNAVSALNYINENLQTHEKLPEVILLDIQMPEMDGFGFLHKFQYLPENILNSIIVIMISSTVDLNDIERAETNPLVFKLLRKPIETDHFKEAIKAAHSHVRSL
jgi:CheY-like chemotaxis protein